jgi:hypothetical protein
MCILGGQVFLFPDTLNPNWKVVIQKEPQTCRVMHEDEDLVLHMQDLEEELVAQSSMSEHMFHASTKIEGDKISVAKVQQAATEATQAEATYNFDDDLEETKTFTSNPQPMLTCVE